MVIRKRQRMQRGCGHAGPLPRKINDIKLMKHIVDPAAGVTQT